MVEKKWIALSNTTVGTFMALLDTSIVLISLPTIGKQLAGTSPEILLWVVLSYSLVTTTLLLSLGRLSDMYGRVRLYTLGFAIFTVGSALSSAALSGEMLLASRVLQGVGAGFLSANSGAILTDAFPANERGRALGINQVAAISGGMMGLVLGGVLTTTLGWRSIFWVNIPVGIFGTLWAHYHLPRDSTRDVSTRIDWAGNLAFGLGLTLLLVGATLGGLDGWASPIVVGLLGAGAAGLVAFLFVEGRVPHPMFDLSLFRIRTFSFGNSASLLSSLARGAFSFIMVFYFQGLLNDPPLEAGLLLLPLSLAFVLVGPVSGWASDRTGARSLGTVGLLTSAVGFLVLLQFPFRGPYDELALAMLLLGAGQGMFAAPNRAEVMTSVPAVRRGVSSGMGMTFLNAGQLGSLVVGFTILAGTVPRSTLATVFIGAATTVPLDTAAFMAALHTIFLVGFVVTLAAAATNAVRGSSASRRSAGGATTHGPGVSAGPAEHA